MHHCIDLQTEQVIAISEVPRHLPRNGGKQTHYQTVFRWVTKGANGRLLASVKIGGRRYTSLEALNRFLQHGKPPARRCQQQGPVERALRDAGL